MCAADTTWGVNRRKASHGAWFSELISLSIASLVRSSAVGAAWPQCVDFLVLCGLLKPSSCLSQSSIRFELGESGSMSQVRLALMSSAALASSSSSVAEGHYLSCRARRSTTTDDEVATALWPHSVGLASVSPALATCDDLTRQRCRPDRLAPGCKDHGSPPRAVTQAWPGRWPSVLPPLKRSPSRPRTPPGGPDLFRPSRFDGILQLAVLFGQLIATWRDCELEDRRSEYR